MRRAGLTLEEIDWVVPHQASLSILREVAQRLQDGVKRGDYLGVAELVPDEMVEAFIACGPADEVRKKIEPLWEVADSLCPVPAPYGLPAQKVLSYGGAIASTFYG